MFEAFSAEQSMAEEEPLASNSPKLGTLAVSGGDVHGTSTHSGYGLRNWPMYGVSTTQTKGPLAMVPGGHGSSLVVEAALTRVYVLRFMLVAGADLRMP